MKILAVKAHNFVSYNDLNLEFKNLGLTLLAAKNGSGKSTILDAVLYALYGQTAKSVKADEVIKNDQNKNCLANVKFKQGKYTYTVKRYRKDSKYHNKVLLYQNKKDITPSTNRETNQKIEEIIGFNFDTMMNSLVFSPERLNTFINSTDKNRKEILEQLTNTNVYKQAEALVKQDAKDNSESLSKVQSELDKLITLEQSQKSLEASYKANKKQHSQQVDQLKQQLNNLGDIKSIDYSEKLAKLNQIRKATKEMLQPFDMNELNSKQQSFNNLVGKQGSLKSQCKAIKESLLQNLAAYKRIKAGEQTTCELCGSVLTDQHKQQELRGLAQRIQDDINEYRKLNQQLQAVQNQYEQLRGQIYALRQQQEKVQQDNQEAQEQIEQIDSEISSYQQKQLSNQNQLKQQAMLSDQLKQLEANPVQKPDTLNPAKYQQSIKDTKLKIQAYKNKDKHYQQLIKVYSDKGVKATALSLVIPYLNDQLAHYLKLLSNGNLNAYLSSSSKAKNGNVHRQISLNIQSQTTGDHYQDLSSGEKQRIGIALNIAFMNYLIDQIGGINICFFDEVFDHLDSEAISQVMNILTELKKKVPNIIVISHDSQLMYQNDFDTQLKVKKVNNTSSLVDN